MKKNPVSFLAENSKNVWAPLRLSSQEFLLTFMLADTQFPTINLNCKFSCHLMTSILPLPVMEMPVYLTGYTVFFQIWGLVFCSYVFSSLERVRKSLCF